MTFQLYDVVKTLRAHPGAREDGGTLAAGSVGTIVHIFDEPDEAFEVEFCDDNGVTTAEIPLRRDEIEPT